MDVSSVEEGLVVRAACQTAGVGQKGNVWESDGYKNLTFSVLLKPIFLPIANRFMLTKVISLAMVDFLKQEISTETISIKWPNDIYWHDKKIGGNLIENELEGAYITQSILGIGLNINQEEFHSSAPNPISLKQILGVEADLEEILSKVIHGIVGGYRQLEANFNMTQLAIRTLYVKNLYRKKGFYPYRDKEGEFKAEFDKIESDGHLVLKDEAGNLRCYAFKEVEFIL